MKCIGRASNISTRANERKYIIIISGASLDGRGSNILAGPGIWHRAGNSKSGIANPSCKIAAGSIDKA